MNAQIINQARKALSQQDAKVLLKLSEEMLRSSNASDQFSGYMFRGMAFEMGGDGVPIDLHRAVECYRKAGYPCRDDVVLVSMARALMKQGGLGHADALACLDEAAVSSSSPELMLAYAKYHETCAAPDYELARSYYLKAALHGRLPGFFGYSAMSRKLRRPITAFTVDCVRLLLGPFLFLLLGRRASKGF